MNRRQFFTALAALAVMPRSILEPPAIPQYPPCPPDVGKMYVKVTTKKVYVCTRFGEWEELKS